MSYSFLLKENNVNCFHNLQLATCKEIVVLLFLSRYRRYTILTKRPPVTMCILCKSPFEAINIFLIYFLEQEDIHNGLPTISDMNATVKLHLGNLARPTFHPISTVYS